MLTEDYVSFEIAKLLKEKGFDAYCTQVYNIESGKNLESDFYTCKYVYNSWLDKNEPRLIAAPTLQLAMKWLRREHGLHCSVDYDYVLGWYCQITNLKETVEYDYEEMKHYHPEKDNGFSSPEEAYEVAIKYCLENLI